MRISSIAVTFLAELEPCAQHTIYGMCQSRTLPTETGAKRCIIHRMQIHRHVTPV